MPIIISALTTILSFLFRKLTLQFIIFTCLYFIVTGFFSVISTLLPKSFDIQSLFNSLPDSIWYLVSFFNIALGTKLVINAYVTRFIIRRIPFVG